MQETEYRKFIKCLQLIIAFMLFCATLFMTVTLSAEESSGDEDENETEQQEDNMTNIEEILKDIETKLNSITDEIYEQKTDNEKLKDLDNQIGELKDEVKYLNEYIENEQKETSAAEDEKTENTGEDQKKGGNTGDGTEPTLLEEEQPKEVTLPDIYFAAVSIFALLVIDIFRRKL